ncbi:sugar-binding protein [Salmonella enterica subsp. enterica]|nr:sugar-binding protein [Salmonella enterica subsp. enterica] [Salmonella enterica subsp. enterica serovar Menston]
MSGLCHGAGAIQLPQPAGAALRLTGNRRRAVIFDEHTQQGYIFTPVSPAHAACVCPLSKTVTATKSAFSITAWAI